MSISQLIGLPRLASEHGGEVDKLIIYVHVLMVALFVGWMVYFVYVLFRFRAKRQPKADHTGLRGHASTWVEGAVAAIEGVLLIFFAVPLWSKVVDDFPKESESTVIRLLAQQFNWNAIYAGADGVLGKRSLSLVTKTNQYGVDPEDPAGKDDIYASQNQVVIPDKKPVIIHLSSLDVIHSLKLYQHRVNQDAIPGQSVAVHFTPKGTGKFTIVCAQLCGNSHYAMRGVLEVMSAEDYLKWLEEKKQTPAVKAGDFE